MRVLFLHQNFPGQFRHVALALQQQGDEVLALVPAGHSLPQIIPTRSYPFDTRQARTNLTLAGRYTDRVARGAAVAAVMRQLKGEGFTPDLVVGHCGWGETLFVRDVWPDSRILLHAEFFYKADNSDVDFDPEFRPRNLDQLRMEMRTRNSTTIIGLLDADQGITPTAFQADLFPEPLRSRIVVLHEGVDTDLICPSPGATVTLDASGLTLRPGDELVTFVNRDLEPYRGYHIFMRALPRILARRPKARAILVGGDGVSYGAAAPPGKNWRNIFFNEVRERLDTSRVHFVGRVPHQTLRGLMQVTAAHVYLTYPFVLSWSMLEAMSAGALVIGSRTPPVEEVITHGSNGLLCDFFDVDGLADAVIDALADQPRYQPLRDAARRSVVARYDLKRVCLPAWLSLCRGPAPPIVR